MTILRGFDQPRREFHCSFLQECSKNNQSAGDTDGPVPGGTGVLWSNMTHYLAILYTAAIIYPCSELTMTASYPYTRLEIPTPPFISLFTDFMRRTEYIWRNLNKIVHVHLMIYYLMFYIYNLLLKYALHPNFPPLTNPRITF